MSNDILVALGGTGARVMIAFRKRMYQEFRNGIAGSRSVEDALSAPREDIALGYLLVDSSQEYLDEGTEFWKVLGQSVQPQQNSMLYIRSANLKERLANIRDHPNLRPWLGDPAVWKEVPSNVI